ncbi:MAG: nucleotidyltransferase domain-containing protein [Oscillospiraceae bacterium]|nr:nucleotidyltransferase domain-containing protein [Oscillospiraceae bacterium]
MCTRSQANEILQRAYHACVPLFGGALRDAYLYGSYARGDFTPTSDVDILLTVAGDAADISARRRDVAAVASALSLEYDVTVSLTVKPAEQFDRFCTILPFYSNVITEGVRYAG